MRSLACAFQVLGEFVQLLGSDSQSLAGIATHVGNYIVVEPAHEFAQLFFDAAGCIGAGARLL